MPDIETQTENFVIIHEEDLRKLPLEDRKKYKIDLKLYKQKLAKEKRVVYMREYMNNYSKMKRKYDPSFRARKIIHDTNFRERRKLLKNEIIETPEQVEDQPQDPSNLLMNHFLNIRF